MPTARPAPHVPLDAPPYAWTGERLGRSVLVYVLAVIGAITLQPFDFHLPVLWRMTLWADWFDAITNVMLFVAPGFLYALTRSAREADPTTPRARRRLVWHTTAVGCLVSATIEATQLLEPTRYPSPVDVATNTIGAALGAWLFLRAARRLGADTPIVGRLALELPLMGLVYVLVPLCTLASLTLAGDPVAYGPMIPSPRAFALPILALFGGTLLGHVQRRHFGPAGTLSRAQTGLVAGVGMAVSALPALATAPAVFGASIVVAAVAAWSYGATNAVVRPINRRFETSALVRAAPWLVAYLALVPLTDRLDEPTTRGAIDMLRYVEPVAGFTVLGYLLAEAWGRLELRYRWTAWRVGGVASIVALLAEALRHASIPWIGSLPMVAVSTISAAYGGWIYHLQRAHVRALVTERTRQAEQRRAAGPARRRRSA